MATSSSSHMSIDAFILGVHNYEMNPDHIDPRPLQETATHFLIHREKIPAEQRSNVFELVDRIMRVQPRIEESRKHFPIAERASFLPLLPANVLAEMANRKPLKSSTYPRFNPHVAQPKALDAQQSLQQLFSSSIKKFATYVDQNPRFLGYGALIAIAYNWKGTSYALGAAVVAAFCEGAKRA